MTTNGKKSPQLDYARVEFLIARYTAFRNEMQNRSSYNYQMISLHLTISAAILSFGLQSSSAASVLFVLPIISMLLGVLAAHNWLARKRLELIIKSDIETEFNFIGKDSSAEIQRIPRLMGGIAEGGVFVLIQILALVLGLLKEQNFTTLDTVLIISDILSVLIILWLLRTVIRTIRREEPPV